MLRNAVESLAKKLRQSNPSLANTSSVPINDDTNNVHTRKASELCVLTQRNTSTHKLFIYQHTSNAFIGIRKHNTAFIGTQKQ